MLGFLMSKPKVLRNTSYELFKQQAGYFIIMKTITSNKFLDFPFTSKINEERGVRDFTNDMGNEIIYIDKASLEDLIEFHDAQFEIADGYHFNDGRNNKVHNVIEDLNNLKLKLKKVKTSTDCHEITYEFNVWKNNNKTH